MSRTLDTRIQNKCDTAANWKNKPNFIPLRGELIIYTNYTVENSDVETVAIKYGDGATEVNELPFVALGTSGESAGKLDPVNIRTATSSGQFMWQDPRDLDDATWLGTIVVRTSNRITENLNINDVLTEETAIVVVHYQRNDTLSEQGRNKYLSTAYSDVTRSSTAGKNYYYYFYAYTDKGVYSDVVEKQVVAEQTVITYVDRPYWKNNESPNLVYNGSSFNILDYIDGYDTQYMIIKEGSNVQETLAKTSYKVTFQLKDPLHMVWRETSTSTEFYMPWKIKKASITKVTITDTDGNEIVQNSILEFNMNETKTFYVDVETNNNQSIDYSIELLKGKLTYEIDKSGKSFTLTVNDSIDGVGRLSLLFPSDGHDHNWEWKSIDLYYDLKESNLDEYTWSEISRISKQGQAKDYFNVGDCKKIKLTEGVSFGYNNGYVVGPDEEYYAYIIGFDHNAEIEDIDYDPNNCKGSITFALFRSTDDAKTPIALCASQQADASVAKKYTDGTTGVPQGGIFSYADPEDLETSMRWYGSTLRKYLGSSKFTDGTGDVADDCATNPRKNTLMEALPEELRREMRKIKKLDEDTVFETYVDFLTLLHSTEIYNNGANDSNLKQYEYFINNSPSMKNSKTPNTACWALRDKASYLISNKTYVRRPYALDAGETKELLVGVECGLVPIFKV